MIAMRLPAIRSVRLQLTPRVRRLVSEVLRGCGWLSLGLGLGALTDLIVRLVA